MNNKIKKISSIVNNIIKNPKIFKNFFKSVKNDGVKITSLKIKNLFNEKNFISQKYNYIGNKETVNLHFLELEHREVLYVFPVIDFIFRIQRPQQLAKCFNNYDYKVIYFKTTFNHSTNPGYMYELLDNGILNVTLFLNEIKNIYVDKLSESNIRFLLRGIGLFEKDFLINKRMSIIDHPFWFTLSKNLSGNFTVYDCMDYHPGFGNESQHLIEIEELAMKNSDLLILTSNDLFERFNKKNMNSILVRNACDFEFFSYKPENIYKGKYEKIIGYYGAISSWFDTELVFNLAKKFPNYEFLLVGSTMGCEKIELLYELNNITLIGEVKYEDLPNYLYSFDVAIMPFKVNELTIATNPVKVYEYLCSGVSVVSTKLPEIDLMGEVVYSAKNFSEFSNGIIDGLEKIDNITLEKRLSFAKQNDWHSRYFEIEKMVLDLKRKKPKVSIILVTYNNLDFTRVCLSSMEKFNNYDNFEIIVVDNLSKDGTREFLKNYEKSHSNFKAILNSENSGFAGGNNIGIRESTGDIIILLNNDTYVTPNWIQNLIKHFNDDNIGMVGPRTNNIGNESRLNIKYSKVNNMIDESYDIYYKNVNKQYEISILAFFCVAIKREIIEKIGLLDEIYGIGMFEDDDYCMRVKKEGYKLVCADDVFIHHHLGASFDKNPEWKEQLFQKNKAIYESRWGKWEGHNFR